MSTFWTADCHWGHENILRYCNRPFKNVDRMHTVMALLWNQRVKDGDTVIHVGDWCNKGNERGVPGSRERWRHWAEPLNGTIVFMTGNHDKNNGLKNTLDSAVMTLAGKKAYIVHKPPRSLSELPPGCSMVLCGHVHDAWSSMLLEDSIPMINVGVDVRKFTPMSINEIMRSYFAILKTKERS